MNLRTAPERPSQNPIMIVKLSNPKYESWKTFLPKNRGANDNG
jgi:hypothetical protein